MPDRIVCLVPYRPDRGHRDRLAEFVRDRWAREHPGIPRFEAPGPLAGPFNRAKALHEAAQLAGDWRVAVIADADSFTPPQQVMAAADQAYRSGVVTFAHTEWIGLNREATRRVLAGGEWGTADAELRLPRSVSSMLAVPRRLWDRVGGPDPGFVGWGGEDVAFAHALTVMGGGQGRIVGPVWHLWHPVRHVYREVQANTVRMHQYQRATTAADMRALLRKLRP